MPNEKTSYWYTRFVFQRLLGFIYFLGFLIILNQYIALLGENGLLPIRLMVKKYSFASSPSLFWWSHSDTVLTLSAWLGLILSVVAVSGLSERFGQLVSILVWGLLWVLYLSFVNVGQVFYGFGWESILLETGFLAIFLGSRETEPSKIPIWLLRWVLFRVMFGAGLIKLRGDACWRDLTCMAYHYETQPIPNPLSWYFHHLPLWFHKGEVLFTHFIELIVPWTFFAAGWIVAVGGLLTVFFQVILIFSGNLSWLNYMTIVLCIACFDDRFFSAWLPLKPPEIKPMNGIRKATMISLAVFVGLLSIQPTVNLISPAQMMNASFNPLHLVNTYGAFGGVTKVRHEVILSGTTSKTIGPDTQWTEYEFKCKPGSVDRRPCIVSPYHLRLDWQIWFAAMSDFRYHPWILNLVDKLLEGDPKTLKLLDHNPFPKAPPHYIKADLYEYRFTTPEERDKTGQWWIRTLVGPYLPPLSEDSPSFMNLLRRVGWKV